MSRVIYNFPGYEPTTEEDSCKKLAEQIDNNIFNVIRRDAGIKETISSENFLQELKKAIEILNTPEYALIANPKHKELLDEFVETADKYLFKTLYSPIVHENEIIVVKYGAVAVTPHLPYTFEIDEAKVLHPEEVRLFEVK